MKKKRSIALSKPGIFKTHEYTTYRIAPVSDNTNEEINTLVKSFHSILNTQMFKSIRDGQPVIAFELYADKKEAFYMYTVPTMYHTMMKEKIQSAYKGGGIRLQEPLSWPFNENTKEVLIAGLSLTKHPYFPIDMTKDANMCKDLLHLVDEIKEGEKLFLQILIEPADNGWQDDIERAYEEYLYGNSSSTGSFLKSGGRRMDEALTNWASSFTDREESKNMKYHREIKSFKEKRKHQGFHVSIRLAAGAPSYRRRNDLIEGTAAAFKTTNGDNTWQIQPVIRKKATLLSMKERKMPLLNSQMILCDEELKTIIKLPTKEMECRQLDRMTPDERKIDDRLTEKMIPVGTAIAYGEEQKVVGFRADHLDTVCKGRMIIAPPGSGKTVMAQIFKNGAMDVGHGGSIFDIADGKLYYGSIKTTPPEHRDKLVCVNFANEHYPHVFNFNSLGRDADTVGTMFAEFFEIFFKTASNYRMNSYLRKSAMSVFTNPDATFLELIKWMRDEDYRKIMLPELRKHNPELFLWWKTEFPKIVKTDGQATEILQPILYRLEELQMNPRLGPIFCGQGGKLEIAKWMNEGKWVLYNLSNGVFFDYEQRILMSFLNYAYWIATLQREKMMQNDIEPIPHHKLFDEPQTYLNATPVFELSISKSRKYRVSDNFFIQNPEQVIDSNPSLWKQIVGMKPHIMIGGGLDSDGMKLMSKEFGIKAEELKQLESLEHHWYMKTYVGKNAISPFIIKALPEPKNYGDDPKLINHWRQHFAPLSTNQIKEDKEARNFNLTIEEYRKLLDSYHKEDTDEEEGVPLG